MNPSQKIVELLDKVPAADAQTVQSLYDGLLADDAATAVRELTGLVGDEFGSSDGVNPKYALHGLVMYASRPGAEEARKVVAETLAGSLAENYSDERKAFICRQLQLCGRIPEIPALAKLLSSERLCEPATQALLAIGGDQAAKALRTALPQAKGPCQMTLRQAVDLIER